MARTCLAISLFLLMTLPRPAGADWTDLTHAVVVIRGGELSGGEKIASVILTEELAKRTGVTWTVTTEWPESAETVIALSNSAKPPAWQNQLPLGGTPPSHAEAFAIRTVRPNGGGPQIVQVQGFDERGVLFGVGKLLRSLDWRPGQIRLAAGFQTSEAPDRPIRGHQIGYRDTANSWDAWTFEQFDQYFREIAIFGGNAVENIPFQDDKGSPLFKYSREAMNYKFGELCQKYDLDHWIWVPVLINLPNAKEEEAFLQKQEQFYSQLKRLDAIFVPGGDPGHNKANVLLPYLKRMGEMVAKHHPRAKIWLSMQYFKPDDIDFLYAYLDEFKPTWFGGIVMGPSSPPMEPTRKRLAKQYKLRWYPDITHCVRAQYPVPWIDPALGSTLGREPVNPRPVDYTQIYQMDYGFTDGFVTYSDGVHDDFNKSLWSQLGWNPQRNIRDTAREFARFYFSSDTADTAADGLFALETNLRGPLAENGSVHATYRLWRDLEQQIPQPGSRWRFRMHLFRANYDEYTRKRLLYETELEQQALAQLATAAKAGVAPAIQQARETLQRTLTQPIDSELMAKLNALGEELFQEIGLQTSVPKYKASNSQRGAVLDFLEYPLNNRWWLEDQFDQVLKMSSSEAQLKRLDVIRNWENPGPGGYYDILGHVGRSPRVVKLLFAGDVMRNYQELPIPTQRWMREDRSNIRLAWHVYQNDVPSGIVYNDLDSSAHYIVRLFSQRESPLLIDGKKAKLLRTGETFDKVTEQVFDVPVEASRDGKIILSWEKRDESDLNWRNRHYVTDIWVMKQPAP